MFIINTWILKKYFIITNNYRKNTLLISEVFSRRNNMSIEINNDFGKISINEDVIASVAGGAAVSCYGIIGMASKKQVKDGISEILGKENYSKGIVVKRSDNTLVIDMYIIVMYGTKISVIANNVQSSVKYQIEKTLGVKVDEINIFIQDIKVVNK